MRKIYHYYKDCKFLINFLKNYRKSSKTIGSVKISFEENEAVFRYYKNGETPFGLLVKTKKEFRLKLKR